MVFNVLIAQQDRVAASLHMVCGGGTNMPPDILPKQVVIQGNHRPASLMMRCAG